MYRGAFTEVCEGRGSGLRIWILCGGNGGIGAVGARWLGPACGAGADVGAEQDCVEALREAGGKPARAHGRAAGRDPGERLIIGHPPH